MSDQVQGKDKQQLESLRTTPVSVSPKSCLWFAWTPLSPPISGPEGEDESSRPAFDVVQPGAIEVRITASDGKWWHHDADKSRSGPNGLDGTEGTVVDKRGLENPSYKSADYNSEWLILKKPIPLNKLVAAFQIGDDPPEEPTQTEILEVGKSANLSIPSGSTMLFFGFHDGRQWTNNGGDNIELSITWLG